MNKTNEGGFINFLGDAGRVLIYGTIATIRTIWEGIKFSAYLAGSIVLKILGAKPLPKYQFSNPWSAPVFDKDEKNNESQDRTFDEPYSPLIDDVFENVDISQNGVTEIDLTNENKIKDVLSEKDIERLEQDVKQIFKDNEIDADIEVVNYQNKLNIIITDNRTNKKSLIEDVKIAPPICYKEKDYLQNLSLMRKQNESFNKLNMVLSNINPNIETEVDNKINAIMTLDIIRKCSEVIYADKYKKMEKVNESFCIGNVSIPVRAGYQNYSINIRSGMLDIADNDSKYIQSIKPDKDGFISINDKQTLINNLEKEYKAYDTGSADFTLYSNKSKYNLNITMKDPGEILIYNGKKELMIESSKAKDLSYVRQIEGELSKLTNPKVGNLKEVALLLCTCVNPNIDLLSGDKKGYPITVDVKDNRINITDISGNEPDITTCITNWAAFVRNCQDNPDYISDMADTIKNHNGKTIKEINLDDLEQEFIRQEYVSYDELKDDIYEETCNKYSRFSKEYITDLVNNKEQEELETDIDEISEELANETISNEIDIDDNLELENEEQEYDLSL